MGLCSPGWLMLSLWSELDRLQMGYVLISLGAIVKEKAQHALRRLNI